MSRSSSSISRRPHALRLQRTQSVPSGVQSVQPPAASPAPSPAAHPAAPPTRPPSPSPAAAVLATSRISSWDGEAARRVLVPPSARDGGGARTPRCPRCVVGVPRRRVWEDRHRLLECGATTTRRSPPCSHVHPVTLYTPSQPSTVPLQAARLSAVCSARAEWHNPSLALSCNVAVNDTSCIRRCWCSSDAGHNAWYVD
jgi:hypothetical protein